MKTTMISVETALSLVLDRVAPTPVERRATRDSLGMTLAEDVVSDIHSPPHDKTLVDGYAVRVADFSGGLAELTVLEEVSAGAVPTRPATEGAATRIFTGAPIPDGADAVVMIERSELLTAFDGPSRVRLTDPNLRPGQNIMRRGQSLRCDERVLQPGHRIRAIEVGLLSEVGRTEILVRRRPRVAVLATGDELTPVEQRPAPGQIRNSNGPMLEALVVESGCEPIGLGVARDSLDDLRRAITLGLTADVLVVSGGVSAGAFDLAPRALADAGVLQVFHKVNLKPGKPLWFGAASEGAASDGAASDGRRDRLVFGLPGNPVGSLVCFELFVRPALQKMSGRGDWTTPVGHGRLSGGYRQRGDRPTYYPAFARLEVFQETASGARNRVELLDWQGSADLKTLASANCLAYFPAGDRQYAAGDEVTIYWL